MPESYRPRHVLEVRDEAGAMYASLVHMDVSVARHALVRAVEEWFDTVIIPNWPLAQLDALPQLTARVR